MLILSAAAAASLLAACGDTDTSPPPGSDAGAPDGGAPLDVGLSEAPLEVTPLALDFGRVRVGTTAVREVEIRSAASFPVEVQISEANNVAPCPASSADYCLRFRDRAIRDGAFRLEGGETARLEVRLSPSSVGARLDAQFTLRNLSAPAPEVTISARGTPVRTGLRCRPGALDFGAVAPGETRTATVACENVANAPDRIRGWAIVSGGDSFSAPASRAVDLPPGERFEIEVTHAPTGPQPAEGALVIEGTTPEDVRVPLRGDGLGPQLAVSPGALDFGEVSLIAPARRRLALTNTGLAPVAIAEIVVDGAATGAFRSPDARPSVLQPGASLTITVELEPRTVGPVASTLILRSDGGPETVVRLRGEGVNLPPCSFELVPRQAVDFGVVRIGGRLARDVEIRNRGPEACLLTSAALRAGADPAFRVASDPRSTRIPPGQSRWVRVEVAPRAAGTFTGTLEIGLSSPQSTFNPVDLRAEAADAPLVAPNELSFGARGVGCRSEARPVTVYNDGPSALTVTEARLARGPASSFSLDVPSLPQTVPSGAFLELSVTFEGAPAPTEAADALFLEVTRGGRVERRVVALDGRVTQAGVHVDRYRVGDQPVDVLFVLDRTENMWAELDALARAVPNIVGGLDGATADWQVGVTTTAAAVDGGRLVSAAPGTMAMSRTSGPAQYRVVTPMTTPSPAAVLAANVSLPLRGGVAADERGLEAARRALSPNLRGGAHARLFRRDARLGLVFLSDEPDQSPGPVEPYLDALMAAVGFRRPQALTASAIVAPSPPGRCTGPSGTARASGRYAALAARTGGEVASVCAMDYAMGAAFLAEAVAGLRSAWPTRQPVAPDTLEVRVAGQVVPATDPATGATRWTFDDQRGLVHFDQAARPDPGDALELRYQATCQ